jgi:diphthine-ammonia ligase
VRRRPSEGEETLQDLWGGAVKVFCSWSGGKESCLACHKAIQEGHEVASLLTMVTTTGSYSRSHRLSSELLIAQSQALRIGLHQRRVSWNTYEREFTKALTSLKRDGIEGGVFGALYLSEDRAWVERVCTEAGIAPLLPLWGMEGRDLLRTFIEEGFEAIVVAVRSDIMDDHWLGKKIDKDFVEQMEKRSIDVCGENGEYHTLVVDGPIFSRRIEISETRVTRRGMMAFLHVSGFTLGQKA